MSIIIFVRQKLMINVSTILYALRPKAIVQILFIWMFSIRLVHQKNTLNGKPSLSGIGKGMPAGTEPDYAVGDRVRHFKFGAGTVTALVREPRDYKVSVDFDAHGQKVMYASFAKLVKE